MGLLPPLTGKQLIYIILMHCIGAAIVDGAINFGIACAMYRGHNKRISVWVLKHNTLAGDAGVTIIIQIILTWIIDGFLTRMDVRTGKQEPIRTWGLPQEGPVGLWLGRGDFDFIHRGSVNQFFRLILSGLRGFVYCVLVFCIAWPLAVAYLVTVYGGNTHIGGWGPELFKLVYGAILGILCTPPVTILALCEAGRKEDEAGSAVHDGLSGGPGGVGYGGASYADGTSGLGAVYKGAAQPEVMNGTTRTNGVSYV